MIRPNTVEDVVTYIKEKLERHRQECFGFCDDEEYERWAGKESVLEALLEELESR